VRGFVQRYFGYAMTAHDREQVFAIFHGEGKNGKSTLIDAVAKVMGDYSVSLPVASLINDGRTGKGTEATPDLARLPGARLVRCAEPKEGLGLDESLIKQLTSSEPIPVRRLHKEFIDVYPTYKIVISANRKPVIRGNDDGIWRRVLLVPFEVQIPDADVDKSLPAKLLAEREGILAWLIEGTASWLEAGLQVPDAVKVATQEFREESDIVGGFARGALEVTGNASDVVGAGLMYNAFVVYCQKQGIPPLNGHTFGRRIKKSALQLGFQPHKSSLQYYIGVIIRDDFKPEHGRHRGANEAGDAHD
jgi:putative DNA primase/helicase